MIGKSTLSKFRGLQGQRLAFGSTPRAPAGFTLFEVSIALVIITVGVLSVLMLFPSGIKAQQMARFQILAAAKAEEMIETFTSVSNSNPAIDTEGLTMWDVPSAHRSQSWDLESRLCSHRFGLMPVPLDIAKRIDSDGDEIQRILGQGGYIYYSQPGATSGTQEQGQSQAPPNEAQRLIIAVSGYAQQNCLHLLPVKNWPYHTPMPSPPLHGLHMPDKFLPTRVTSGRDYWNYHAWPNNRYQEDWCYPWETVPTNLDRDIQKVYDWPEGDIHYGYFPYACGRRWGSPEGAWNDPNGEAYWAPATALQQPNADDTPNGHAGEYPSRASCIRYVQAALWYCAKKGLNPGRTWEGTMSSSDPYQDFEANSESERWKEVQGMRFLAHAATCLTAWYPKSSSTEPDDLTRGITIPGATLDSFTGPSDVKITEDHIRYYHERALYLVMQFAARYPNDWSIPRPLQRVQMMDFPLLQADLFSPPYPEPASGPVTNPTYGDLSKFYGRSQTDNPKQWRPVSPEPIRNIGVSWTYPTNILDATMDQGRPGPLFGDIDHFNLTAPFKAAERCREIIMWAADWMSYEDFETAPSAPVDASKYPLAGPRGDWWGNGRNAPTLVTRNFNGRMWDVDFRDEQLWAYRNPEKYLLFYPQNDRNATSLLDIAAQPTGTDMSSHMIMNNPWGYNGTNGTQNLGWLYPDRGPEKVYREVFNGRFGGDRNFNKKLDRGPVPKSVRLRAIQVARFNFYDPRVQTILR